MRIGIKILSLIEDESLNPAILKKNIMKPAVEVRKATVEILSEFTFLFLAREINKAIKSRMEKKTPDFDCERAMVITEL